MMKRSEKHSIKELLTVWTYDPNSGNFYWTHSFKGYRKGTKAGSNKGLYIELAYRGGRYYAHRVAWAFVHGEWPKQFIDHINANKLDNRISNLRAASRSQNAAYSQVRRDSLTGRKGVSRDRRDGRYYAYLDNGSREFLGGFDTLSDADEARKKAETALWGEFSWIR